MKAMVLAAGLGTRLRPLTDTRPKALVEVAGRTLLEIVLRRLQACGVGEAIVNVHHCAGMIADYLRTNHNFGMRIELSREAELLDTGGGLQRAGWFFRERGDAGDEPFLLHNVDVISTIDLRAMAEQHRRSGALATLAVQRRTSSRQLLFDGEGQLCGRRIGDAPARMARAAGACEERAFCGIHVISPRLLERMERAGAFSIIDAYLDLAAREPIRAFAADGCYWRDLGRPESVAQAARDYAQKLFV
jgi:NDP-sugar pyrophosphorylase family protein